MFYKCTITCDFQVGLINYSNKAKLEIKLNDYTTKAQLDAAIASVPYKDGNTNTSGAIWRLENELFSFANGDRSAVPNIALVSENKYTYFLFGAGDN